MRKLKKLKQLKNIWNKFYKVFNEKVQEVGIAEEDLEELFLFFLQNFFISFFIKISVKHDTSAKSKNEDVKDIAKKSHLHFNMIDL